MESPGSAKTPQRHSCLGVPTAWHGLPLTAQLLQSWVLQAPPTHPWTQLPQPWAPKICLRLWQGPVPPLLPLDQNLLFSVENNEVPLQHFQVLLEVAGLSHWNGKIRGNKFSVDTEKHYKDSFNETWRYVSAQSIISPAVGRKH